MSVTYDFTDKVALVTGSSSGIGAIIVQFLAKSGARVVVTGRNRQKLSQTISKCLSVAPNPQSVLEVLADVNKPEDLRRLLDTTLKTFGKLDVLVNNAGMALFGSITDPDYVNKFNQVMQTNLNSIIQLTHLAVPELEKTQGNIINVSSVISLQSGGVCSPYLISKAALNMFTKCIAVELGPKKIRVNAILPGAVRTDFIINNYEFINNQEQSDACWDAIGATYPLGRCSEGIDIAQAVAYLASEQANFITGSLFVVDGGHLVCNADIMAREK